MDPGRIPKDLLYGDGGRFTHAGRPKLRFKDVCKRNMKRCNIDSNSWESIADDRPSWRQTVKQGAKFAEEALTTAGLDKRSRRKERGKYPQQPTPFSFTNVFHELSAQPFKEVQMLKLWSYTIVSQTDAAATAAAAAADDPQKPLKKIILAICNHQPDCPLCIDGLCLIWCFATLE